MYLEKKKYNGAVPTFECILRAQREVCLFSFSVSYFPSTFTNFPPPPIPHQVYSYLSKKYFKKYLESKYYQDYRNEMLKITPVENDLNFSESTPVETTSFGESEFGKRIKK